MRKAKVKKINLDRAKREAARMKSICAQLPCERCGLKESQLPRRAVSVADDDKPGTGYCDACREIIAGEAKREAAEIEAAEASQGRLF